MKCEYCNADISVAEKICPICQHDVHEKNPETIAKAKKRRWLTIGVAAIAIVFISTTIGMILSSQQSVAPPETTAVKETTPLPNTLGLSYDLLRDRFNDNRTAGKMNIVMQNASGNVFQYNLDKTILVSGTLDPATKQVVDFKLIAKPTSRDESIHMLASIGVLIESIFPSDAERKRTTILEGLGFKKGADIRQADNTVIDGDYRFRFTAVKDIGYVFTIAHKDAKAK